MIRYAIVLAAPVVGGVLIAVAIILITELRERRERRRMALREARHLDRAPARRLCRHVSSSLGPREEGSDLDSDGGHYCDRPTTAFFPALVALKGGRRK